ncbi:MAG: hypothetical protein LBT97_11370 [Planctomycetota bacterium]|nr:hypothetical protein [Planctomycetota bacterium]
MTGFPASPIAVEEGAFAASGSSMTRVSIIASIPTANQFHLIKPKTEPTISGILPEYIMQFISHAFGNPE